VTDDLKRILSAIFKLGKGTGLSKTEMVNLMIYNLRWFDPQGARSIVKAGFQSGLLKTEAEGQIIPTFDIIKQIKASANVNQFAPSAYLSNK